MVKRKEMKTSEEIRTEPDPFLREIWAMGYDFIYDDILTETIILCRKGDEYQKRIPRRGNYFYLKIIRGVLPDGTIHAWLCERDGSADKFRQLIKPLDFKHYRIIEDMSEKEIIHTVQKSNDHQIAALTREVRKWEEEIKRYTGESHMILHYEWCRCQVTKMKKHIKSLENSNHALSVKYYFSEF